jgi:cyclase
MSSAAAAAAATRNVLFAQQAPAPPAGSFAMVRADVGTFTAQGGTIGWLVNQDAVVVVDTQYARSAPLCLEGLKERSGGRTIDLVFNTHHHADHTGGNGVFQPVSKKIVAHARVPALMKEFNVQPNAPEPVLPSATFDNTWSEQMGRETVSAKHHGPAHTGADAVLHFERANVVHMGDLLWLDLHPRVDRPAGASIQNWLRTLETVSKAMSHDAVFIAGHARAGLPVAVKGDAIVRQRNYFDAILAHVRKGIADKKSLEEIVALVALPGFEGVQAINATINLKAVLTAAYEELTAK